MHGLRRGHWDAYAKALQGECQETSMLIKWVAGEG